MDSMVTSSLDFNPLPSELFSALENSARSGLDLLNHIISAIFIALSGCYNHVLQYGHCIAKSHQLASYARSILLSMFLAGSPNDPCEFHTRDTLVYAGTCADWLLFARVQ